MVFPMTNIFSYQTFPECERKLLVTRQTKGWDYVLSVIVGGTKSMYYNPKSVTPVLFTPPK